VRRLDRELGLSELRYLADGRDIDTNDEAGLGSCIEEDWRSLSRGCFVSVSSERVARVMHSYKGMPVDSAPFPVSA
jgi:hypothetical protein